MESICSLLEQVCSLSEIPEGGGWSGVSAEPQQSLGATHRLKHPRWRLKGESVNFTVSSAGAGPRFGEGGIFFKEISTKS